MDGARAAYAAALASLDKETDPDVREAKRLRLECAWFIILWGKGTADEATGVYRKLLADCAAAQCGEQPASRVMARTSQLLARLHADLHDIEPLSAAELDSLMENIAEEDRGPNFWHEVGCWSFKHGDRSRLDDAYVFFTTQRTPEMADFTFSRLRLMHQLMDQAATVDHVLETIDRVEVLVQLDDFRRLLWPVCETQALATPHVRAALDAKQVEMELHGKRAPQRRQ
jgi:hypothetical protein